MSWFPKGRILVDASPVSQFKWIVIISDWHMYRLVIVIFSLWTVFTDWTSFTFNPKR